MSLLPPSPFISNSATPPSPAVADTAGVSPCPPDAPAGTISDGVPRRSLGAALSETEGAVSVSAAPSDKIHEPSMTNGGDQEAPAPRCTEPHDGAGVLADRIDWHEFFQAVMDERIILFELTNDVPLFIRDGDHLRRWEA